MSIGNFKNLIQFLYAFREIRTLTLQFLKLLTLPLVYKGDSGCTQIRTVIRRLKAYSSTIDIYTHKRNARIKLAASDWKSEVLSLYEFRKNFSDAIGLAPISPAIFQPASLLIRLYIKQMLILPASFSASVTFNVH